MVRLRRAVPERPLLLGAVGLTMAFFYLPILTIVYLSVASSAQPSIPIEGVTLEWYEEVLTDRRFVRGLANSVGIATVSAILGTTLGLLAARTIVRSSLPRLYRASLALVIALPLFIPTVVLSLGIGLTAGYAGLGFGYGPIILGHLLWVLPFSTFLLTARFARLDDRLEDAGRDLGAEGFELFRSVTYPLLRPAFIASLLFCFALSLNEFLITFFLAGSSVTTMPLEIFGKVRVGATSFLNAASVLVLLFSGVIAIGASTYEWPR